MSADKFRLRVGSSVVGGSEAVGLRKFLFAEPDLEIDGLGQFRWVQAAQKRTVSMHLMLEG